MAISVESPSVSLLDGVHRPLKAACSLHEGAIRDDLPTKKLHAMHHLRKGQAKHQGVH